MAKYSLEEKKKLVIAYLNGEGSAEAIIKKYGYSSPAQLQRWIAVYKKYGENGLARSRQQEKYSFEKKLAVVELYLSSELSFQTVALQEGILNACLVAEWVKRFRVAGPDALKSHKKGRKTTLSQPDKDAAVSLPDKVEIDTSVEHVKELEDELLKLRIENAFLKELRRLRLEDEAKMREQHGSSAASEDSSN